MQDKSYYLPWCVVSVNLLHVYFRFKQVLDFMDPYLANHHEDLHVHFLAGINDYFQHTNHWTPGRTGMLDECIFYCFPFSSRLFLFLLISNF